MSQDLLDPSFRLLTLITEICYLYYYLVTGHSSHITALWDKNILSDLLVIRDHKTKILILLIIAYQLAVGMFQYL